MARRRYLRSGPCLLIVLSDYIFNGLFCILNSFHGCQSDPWVNEWKSEAPSATLVPSQSSSSRRPLIASWFARKSPSPPPLIRRSISNLKLGSRAQAPMTPPTIQWASVWQTHLGHADRQGGISDLGTRLVYGQPSFLSFVKLATSPFLTFQNLKKFI